MAHIIPTQAIVVIQPTQLSCSMRWGSENYAITGHRFNGCLPLEMGSQGKEMKNGLGPS